MDIYGKLLHLYPAMTDTDVRLEERSGTVIVAYWNTAKLGPKPDKSTISAINDTQASTAREAEEISAHFGLSQKDKVLVKWIAQRTGGGTAAEINAELLALWRAT